MSPLPGSSRLGATELEFATFHEGYLSKYIQLADAKAGSVLVVVVAVLGYFLGQDKFVKALLFTGPVGASLAAIGATLLLTLAASMAFLVILPRRPSEGRGLVFWNDVAKLERAEFIDAVQAAGQAGLADERLSHSHTLAKVCVRKYCWLDRAMWVAAVAAPVALIARALL